jgi:hypothetical protein
MQTIESGTVDQWVPFFAPSNLSGFTVQAQRGATAGSPTSSFAMTTPTIVEDTGYRPAGFSRYFLLADEGTSITGGKSSEVLSFVIYAPGMTPQLVEVELRVKYADDVIAVLGTPAGASIAADVAALFARLGAPAGASTAADIAAIFSRIGAPAGASMAVDVAAIFSRLGAPAGASVSADVATIRSVLGTPAGASVSADVASSLATLQAKLGTPAGASVSADIATAYAGILARLGIPAGASVSADVGTAITAIATVLAAVNALNNLSAATVKAQMVAALAADLYAEPAGVPSASAAIATKLGYLFAALRDGIRIDGSNKTFLDQSGVDMWKKPLSDGGGTYLESTAISP